MGRKGLRKIEEVNKSNEKKIKRLTPKDFIEDPVYMEMVKVTDDIAGHLISGRKKFNI